jgi:hypothetical protein
LLSVTLLWLGGCANERPATAMIDFHKEVAPIFKARCVSCHGSQQQQGGLRLDDKAFALQGGLSGKKLVEPPTDECELLRRVSSDNPMLVMPKEGGRLTDREIGVLRRWVTARAPWPEKTPPSGWDEFVARYGNDLWKRLSVHGGEPKVLWLFLFAVFVGVSQRIRRVPVDSVRWSKGLLRRVRVCCPRVSAAGFSVVLLGTILWDLVGFSMRQSVEVLSLEQKLAELGSIGELRPGTMTGAPPKPLRPRGALGLGGTYYRGNDERSEKLFNGGYYRTAILRLTLIDEHDQPLTLGQPVSGSQLFVRLEIERSLRATPELFSEQMMRDVLLTRRTGDRKEPLAFDEPVTLDVLEPGERWAAKYRLGEFTGQPDIALNGIVYVYTGAKRVEDAIHGSQQYGIVYGLRIRERVLQANSQLWLGPILVPGNFQFPIEGRITLSEWLDTNPIPEITSDNSTDPKLLGIPEHLEKDVKPPEK